MRFLPALIVTALVATLGACQKKPPPVPAPPAILPYEIGDAYLYLLGRALVLREQRRDFEQGAQWNQLVHRKPGDREGESPQPDVLVSEAWIVVDEQHCVALEIPKITDRYSTWHVLNGWGETLININERTHPEHPSGKFALCLKGSAATAPEDALRIDLPVNIARAIARVQVGADMRSAQRLQQQFKLAGDAGIEIPPAVDFPLFDDDKLPGVELFDRAADILGGEPDLNPGMESIRAKAEEIAALARASDTERERIRFAIEKEGWPTLKELLNTPGPKSKGWSHPAVAGHYGSDYRRRTMMNLAAPWSNTIVETATFSNQKLDGAQAYLQTFPADALPDSKAAFAWSVSAVETEKHAVMPNPPNRFALSSQSKLKRNVDGSLTIAFAPELPPDIDKANWLPTAQGVRYNLVFKFYGPTADVVEGNYFPPALTAAQ